MLLFIICVLVGIVGLYVAYKWEFTDAGDTAFVIGVCSLIVVVFMSIWAIMSFATRQDQIIELNEMRDAIIHEINSDLDDDDPIAITHDIREYNTKVTNGQYWSHNFWVGMFTPNIYDDYELFSYELDMLED